MNEDEEQLLSLGTREGLPEALRELAREFPREAWETHPHFSGLVQFWMERHMGFRRLLALLEQDFQRFADRELAFEQVSPRLMRFGGLLLNELHGHHQIEDHHYFPRLVGLDPRVEAGFALLERDHDELEPQIHALAEAANAFLRSGESGAYETALSGLARLLDRHLEDEEEIVVPVVLKSGFRG